MIGVSLSLRVRIFACFTAAVLCLSHHDVLAQRGEKKENSALKSEEETKKRKTIWRDVFCSPAEIEMRAATTIACKMKDGAVVGLTRNFPRREKTFLPPLLWRVRNPSLTPFSVHSLSESVAKGQTRF